jgi:hypothetical protein
MKDKGWQDARLRSMRHMRLMRKSVVDKIPPGPKLANSQLFRTRVTASP